MHRLASVGRTGRWLVHGLASELTSNLLPGRAAPPPLSPSQGGLAVVTGATGGIGEEVCRGLAERGFEVCCAARDRRRGEALAASIREGGGWTTSRSPSLCSTELEAAKLRLILCFLHSNRLTEDCWVVLMGGRVPETIAANFKGVSL